MNSELMGIEMRQLQLRAMVLAVSFPPGFIQQVVGWEGLLRCERV